MKAARSLGGGPGSDRPRSVNRRRRLDLAPAGGGRRVCHGAPATSAPVDHASRTGWGRTVRRPPSRATRPRGSTLGSTRRVAGTTSEDLRSEGYTDRGRARTRRGPGGLLRGFLFCDRPKRLSPARKPPSSLRPSSVGASSSAWRRTRSPRPGWPQPPAAARRSAEPLASPERRSRGSCRRRSTP